ncbi:MAG: AlpA family phage regulatory protein [Bradyrhizobium sp.]
MFQNLIPYTALKAKGIPYSKPHLWRLEKAGKFPKRVPIGESRYAYVEEEIDAYVAGLITARDTATDPGTGKPGKRRAADHAPDAAV